jgi:hypothetical protein
MFLSLLIITLSMNTILKNDSLGLLIIVFTIAMLLIDLIRNIIKKLPQKKNVEQE